MDLTTYIADVAVRKRLAAALNSNPHYLYQVATGRRRPSEALSAAIEAATGGAVSCESLRPDLDWERNDQGRVIGYRARVAPVVPDASPLTSEAQ
ncbi:helix-turn-helix domain-containing protein [Dyella marensis]|uniref:transcriptional regulator n=1 Tax=Dyella marensis TaxID=500610 RepID=UPI0031E48EAA